MDMTLAPSGINISAVGTDSVDDAHGSSLTGKVGTALYVSPEIMAAHARTHYNQVRLSCIYKYKCVTEYKSSISTSHVIETDRPNWTHIDTFKLRMASTFIYSLETYL